MKMMFKGLFSIVRVRFVAMTLLCGFNLVSGIMVYDPFFPASVSIVESTRDITRLESIVNCEETDTTKMCTCLIFGSDPFETWWLKGDSGYYVYFDNTARLSVGTYSVSVECRSMNDARTAVSRVLKVVVTPNLPPVIQNYRADAVSFDAKSAPQNSVVYTTSYKDPEDDAVVFTMTSNPNLGHFIIGAGNGKIYSTLDLRYCTVDKYVFTITANDSYNMIKDFVVTLTLTNKNTPPKFKNVPDTVLVKETAKKGDLIITLDTDDPDVFTNMDPWCTPKTPSDMKKLLFDMPKHQIRVAYDDALDYETKSNISLLCSYCDGFLCDSNELLVIAPQSINEPPVWSDKVYFCNIDEGNAGGPTCSLGAILTDPENGAITVDVLTTNNQRLFKYDYFTDMMTFLVDYDVDDGGYDRYVTAIMTATDNKGLSSTATVSINVNDVNDNKCQTETLKTYSLNRYDQLKKLGMFVLEDKDITDQNNNVHLELASSTPSLSVDYVYTTRNGEIYYTNLFPPDKGVTLKQIYYCVDTGVPRQTTTVTLLIDFIIPTTTTPGTTTPSYTTPRSVWSYEEFQATFGTLMALIGLGITVLLGSLVAYCFARNGWRNFLSRIYSLRPKLSPSTEKVQLRTPPHLPKTPTPRPMPPVERPISVNDRWGNVAWSTKDNAIPAGGVHYFHYH